MTSIIKKRQSLHRKLASEREHSELLRMQIGQLQALANIGLSTSMIAHELNNLLTPCANYAALALQHPDDKALVRKALESTARNCERAGAVTESILAVVNGQAQQKCRRQLRQLVQQIFDCLARDFSKDGITVQVEIPEGLTVWAIPVEIQQVLMNLVLNAREAMLPAGGVLKIEAAQNSDGIQIVVSDTGRGISPENIERVFEPFFTTKTVKGHGRSRAGAGLGLAFCKKVVEEHGGSIAVESRLGEGTRFVVRLPGNR